MDPLGLRPEPMDTTEVETALEGEFDRPETTEVQAHRGPLPEPLRQLPPDVRGRIEVLEGPDRGRVFALEQPEATLGRSEDCDIVLAHAAVSASHALIYFSTTREWRIRDLGSTNGTLLNGSRVNDFALRNGDKFVIGGCRLVFLIQ